MGKKIIHFIIFSKLEKCFNVHNQRLGSKYQKSQFPPTLKNFSNGIVDPPKNSVVNNTIMSVVVMITWRVSSEKPRWSDKAYDIAPLSPETKTC